jgi:threonine/homoserine/homoserine lactone efflux protein
MNSMLGVQHLPLFVVSGLLLNITPGADSLYIVARSVSQGSRAGMTAALGIGTGCCVHVVAAALGLSAILASSALAFDLIKTLGAVYLVYIGVSMLRQRKPNFASTVKPVHSASLPTIFAQGFLTNVLNPKVALFFLAFVPQFIEPAAQHKALAFLLLGAIFNFNGTLWCLLLAWSAAKFKVRWQASHVVATWLSRTVGVIFVALGIKLALSQAKLA